MRMNPFARNLRFHMPTDEQRAATMILWLTYGFKALLLIALLVAGLLAIYTYVGLHNAYALTGPITAEHLSPRWVIGGTATGLTLFFAALVCKMRALELETLRQQARTNYAIDLIPAL